MPAAVDLAAIANFACLPGIIFHKKGVMFMLRKFNFAMSRHDYGLASYYAAKLGRKRYARLLMAIYERDCIAGNPFWPRQAR